MNKYAAGVDSIAGLDVSCETLERLCHYSESLKKWTRKINLVSRNSLDNLWERHIVDSAQVYAATSTESGTWLDLGTGGGFPGLVCAVLAKSERPKLTFVFVESDRRKSAFLGAMVRDLDLNARAVPMRIEALPPQGAQNVSARALAPLDKLLELTHPHLSPDGTALFLKGANVGEEISAARTRWRFKLESVPSITDPNATLLRIGDIHSV